MGKTKNGISRRTTLKWGAATGAATSLPAAARPASRPVFAVDLPAGHLSIYALSPRALRVRLAPKGALPASPILLSASVPRSLARVEGHVRGDQEKTLRLREIRCVVDASGRLVFTNAKGDVLFRTTQQSLIPSTVQGQPTLVAEQVFESAPDERLYGTGQFQDGHLNIRGLTRRLTQVNTQISLPFLLSSKGYGILWHNTGMVELNPADHTLIPERVPFDSNGETVSVTTTVGTAQVKRNLAAFECELKLDKAGRYCFQLDVGQSMGNKHYVEIDGHPMVDIDSLWLPPTTSFFAELTEGNHKIRVVGNAKDKPTLGYRTVDDTTTLRSPVSEGVDYVVIAGSPEDIIAEYRRLTGQAPLMPKWAYGYIHCRERYHSSDEILANAREFRARNIPFDVIVQDWQYWGKHGWNAMQFDEANYPDPAGLVRTLHGLNARFMLSVWARVDPKCDVGKSLAARNCFIPGTEWVDFFDRRAAAFYWGAESHRLLSLGVDAWWQDATEPENDDLVGRKTAAGPGEVVRLQYPFEVSRTVYEGQRRDAPDRRVMILTRCAFLGQQRYASATWSGDIGCDWDTLARQIPAGLNMMAAGHPYWTVDAGGFFRPGDKQYDDPAYHELLLRWMQLAVFLPLMRVHGYQSQTEPWHYGPDVERRVRELIELRYRLLPYIYSTAAEVTRKGSSLMRPLVMDFPDDPAALDQPHSYMFGKALHVAPVLKPGVTSWDAYLPVNDGGWYDFWTQAHREGGRSHAVEAPLERVPLHVRAGSILPMGPVVQSTAEADGRALTLNIYPGADGRFELYEDEGTNYNYEKGASSVIALAWDDAARALHLAARKGRYAGMPEQRSFTVQSADTATPVTIHYDGRAATVRLPKQ